MRDSMVFYRSFADAIEDLDESDQLAAFWNIVRYALDGKEPTEAGPARAVFRMAKPQIDANEKRYQNGRKGGRPKTENKPKDNQEKTKREPNENVNVNDNVKDKKHIMLDETVKRIVDYMNEKCGTKYKASTAATAKSIRARLDDGYTEEDFHTVIDKKCAEWLGTEFEKFLRPNTLFSPSHFESYLNQKINPEKPEKKPNSFGDFEQRKYDYSELSKKMFSS